MTDSRWIDPELDGLFDGEPELSELAHRVRAARPEPPLDPRFKNVLRAQLMREAPSVLGAARPARQRGAAPRTIRVQRRGWWQRPGFAWGGAGLGLALVAAAVFTVARTPVLDHQVTAMSPVASLHAVSPDNVITVAFNEPMNEAAVVAGLHIQPATEVSTSWQGNNLLITPKHHLAGNTPYTVTIAHSATQASNGQLAASDIRISFGTAPTPPPAPTIAQLAPQTLAPVNEGAQLITAPNGAVIATGSTAATTAPTSLVPSAAGLTAPSSSPSATASPSASASASPSSSPSATAVPSPAGELVALHPGGQVTNLGPAATSAAVAPNGLRLVAAVPATSGTTIELVPLDGSARLTLASLAAPVLATGWLSNDTALVAEAGRIVTVDLAGHVGTLTTLPQGTTTVVFAPNGSVAFAGSGNADGVLIDLAAPQGQPAPLTGSRQTVAFSGDGSVVAWVDESSNPVRLLTSPVSGLAPTSVPLSRPGDGIGGIALDGSGSHIAVVDQPQDGGGELDLLSLPSGTLLARGAAATSPVFSRGGGEVAFVSGGVAAVAAVPGAASGTTLNPLPDGAASALNAFVEAQVQGNQQALSALSTGIDAAGSTPNGLSRAYVVSAVANPDGTVSATARLIVDPTNAHPAASVADESLTLARRGDGTYAVTALTTSSLQDESIGPHVVSVVPVAGRTLVLRVAFDSDLRAETVASAITVTTRSGRELDVTTVYDPNSRTATVTTSIAPGSTVTLSVATSLIDVDGEALAGTFSTQTGS